MDDHNKLVKIIRMVHDFRALSKNVPVRLTLYRNINFDSWTYNVPDVDEVVVLIVGDFEDFEDGRDIVVKERDGMLHRIHETHSKYIPIQYPLLSPFGDDQYQEHIERNELTSTRTVKKRVGVSVH